MKKKLLVVIGLLSLVLFLFPDSKVTASENIIQEDMMEEVVDFEELSEEEQSHFLDEGFNENNEYFQNSIIQQPEIKEGMQQRLAINVITITGSTKKVSSTRGYTSYVITSAKPILKTITEATLSGYKSFPSTVIPYNSPTVSSGGIYSSYTGAKKYFTVRLASQVTTTLGTSPAGSGAGGVTLGN